MYITGITNLLFEYSLIKLDSSKLAEKFNNHGFLLVRNQNKKSIVGDKLLRSYRYSQAIETFGHKVIDQVDSQGYKYYLFPELPDSVKIDLEFGSSKYGRVMYG